MPAGRLGATLASLVVNCDALHPEVAAPKSVVPVLGEGDDDEKGRKDRADVRIELRTYQVFDRAGNSLQLVERVKKNSHRISVQVVGLQYGQGVGLSLTRNEQIFEWSVGKDGTLSKK